MHQRQGGLVGPLQIVEEEKQGSLARGPGQTLCETLEEVVPQLLWRQFRWRGDIWEDAAQPGCDQGELGGRVPQPLAELLRAGRLRESGFKNFGGGEIGTRLLSLIAVADQGAKALGR